MLIIIIIIFFQQIFIYFLINMLCYNRLTERRKEKCHVNKCSECIVLTMVSTIVSFLEGTMLRLREVSTHVGSM
jgi:hypothetical protein